MCVIKKKNLEVAIRLTKIYKNCNQWFIMKKINIHKYNDQRSSFWRRTFRVQFWLRTLFLRKLLHIYLLKLMYLLLNWNLFKSNSLFCFVLYSDFDVTIKLCCNLSTWFSTRLLHYLSKFLHNILLKANF